MKTLLILGGGTAGTMVANRLRRRLPRDEWRVTVVDRDDQHRYQPGYLFLPFGHYRPEQIVRSRRAQPDELVTVVTSLATYMPPSLHTHRRLLVTPS